MGEQHGCLETEDGRHLCDTLLEAAGAVTDS
jgi:hypothetical protein